MLRFLLRRLGLSALTIFGVMVITFLLFRVIAGDIAAAHVGQKATERQKADWRHLHGYDRPLLVNLDGRLKIDDHTAGKGSLQISDAPGSEAADSLSLLGVEGDPHLRMGRYVPFLSPSTPATKLTGGLSLESAKAAIVIGTAGGREIKVDLSGVKTAGQIVDRINNAPGNQEESHQRLVTASLTDWRDPGKLLDSQFFEHLVKSATFQGRSLATKEKLTSTIAERGPKSLALMIPAEALGWAVGLIISCFVAYYRGSLLDKTAVFLSVLGMCIPFLAFMIIGQWLVFVISPRHAYGLAYRINLYVPITIMVVAGLGSQVRFYRTVILDETNRDYVRTALAKGASLGSILFKHVLKNCMLPILTSLVMTIPFLIMGSLLVESYFGIPGLGDLMITSITGRDEPVLAGLVFLSALIYTLGVLITDILYAVFDPRIRLQ